MKIHSYLSLIPIQLLHHSYFNSHISNGETKLYSQSYFIDELI